MPFTSKTVARKQRPCIESNTCSGGLWRFDDSGQAREEAAYLMRRFLEYGSRDGDGLLRRLTLYKRGQHSRVLSQLAEDWQRERLGELRKRGIFSPDLRARLPLLCGDHLRHALREDVALDRATRTIDFDLATLPLRDLLAVGEITAAACWVPEITTLLILGLSRRWFRWKVRDEIVAAVQDLPPELRWPTWSSLFCLRRVTDPATLEQAVRRFGIAAPVRSERDLQIAQRKIGIRLRDLRKNPSRSRVRGFFHRFLAEQ